MKYKILYSALAVVVVLGLAFFLVKVTPKNMAVITTFEQCAALYPVMESYPEQCNTPDGKHFVRDISGDLSNLIRVDSPVVNATVASPLTITGQARGNWYFEASFPIQLIDANGVLLGEGPVQAVGDPDAKDGAGWMTTEFVPFKGSLIYKNPTTNTGTLIVHNDNPSGDPARDKEIRIPVRFISKPQPKTVKFSAPVTLGLGESAILPDGLLITVKEINDSRCKQGVQCIWAGEISVVLSRANNGEEGFVLEEFRLGTVNNKSLVRGVHVFTLKSATPTSVIITVASLTPASNDKAFIGGYVHVGPVCPVQKNPPDPDCADKPLAGAQVILLRGTQEFARTITDASGNFKISVPVDSYIIEVKPANGAILPRCEGGVVIATGISNVDISCDSGIR